MRALAPDWLAGCRLRPCWFEPTFHKHAGKLCAGIQIHVDDPGYDHERSGRGGSWRSPSRRSARSAPDYPLWRDFAYEYEHDAARDRPHQRRADRCANGSTTRRRRPATSTSSRARTKTSGNRRSDAMRLAVLAGALALVPFGAGAEVKSATPDVDADRASLHHRGARRASLGNAPAPRALVARGPYVVGQAREPQPGRRRSAAASASAGTATASNTGASSSCMPGQMLRLDAALGPLQEMAVSGVITFALDEKDGATTMVVTHRVSGDPSHKLDALRADRGPGERAAVRQPCRGGRRSPEPARPARRPARQAALDSRDCRSKKSWACSTT